jgi:glycosyltransferase involved in cell wall biosynthesis
LSGAHGDDLLSPELVDGSGVLVDPYDVAAIAQGMSATLSDGALRERMIAGGLKRAQHFSWDKCAPGTRGL